jgi:putative PIN family toxin of toxin-antitoxin system
MNSRLVVLDTNCLVSALIFSRGSMSWLRQAWQTGRIIPLICTETVGELLRVLSYPKFALDRAEIEILLGELLPWARSVALEPEQEEVQGLRDRDDAVFVHLARQSGAIFLVSGDRDLLELHEKFPEFRILSPAQFRAELDQ